MGVHMSNVITLADGSVLEGNSPLVVLGPNGSGKTRQARTITSDASIEFVNALRNTRVSPQIPAMGYGDAHNNFVSQRNQAKASHWEISSDFDYLLSQLLAQDAMVAMDYMRDVRRDGEGVLPPRTALSQVEEIWAEVFPGRDLIWKEWAPHVRSVTTAAEGEQPVEYSGNQMSDGEKAALYLAGRVFSVESGILVVDEPETHLHSLLAIRLWDELEAARPDLRFVYVTHDLTFALSRRDARFVLASPTSGLKVLELGNELPDDVAGVLLGSASLSFYARRVVFCEGEDKSVDDQIYNAWFNKQDTVVRSVGSCEMVLRCVDALSNSGIATSLESLGIVDRDFVPDEFIASLPAQVFVLGLHEVESLLCLPAVLTAVAQHLGKAVDLAVYRGQLGNAVTITDRHRIVLDRWKRRLEPLLESLVSTVRSRTESLDLIVADIPNLFDHTKWSFSPEDLLVTEKERVEATVPDGTADEILRLAPGKKFLGIAAHSVGMTVPAYTSLVVTALQGADLKLSPLGEELRKVLETHLPPSSI